MARPKTFTEIDEAVDLFPPGSAKMVTRIIERAAKKELAANRKALRNATAGSRGEQRLGKAAERFIAKQLSQALMQRGAAKRQAPSIRQRAPDSGGRPFHFAHSVVLKSSGRPDGGGAGASVRPGAMGASAAGGGKSKSAAHMRYIEREMAVEREVGKAKDERDGVGGRDHGQDGREQGTSIEESVSGTSRSNQSYIENPVKLANGENVIFSFGTIGEVFEDRVRFWEALEEHEAHPGARVQDRLIVELPHEASPSARHDMVRTFCDDLGKLGLPYWAALHAPGKGNDGRNYHAHIVYSTRPAARMVDPSSGTERWDFEVTESYKTSSRHTKVSHPHRQDREPSLRKVDAIPRMRRRFSEVVNEILVRDDVRDKGGEPVRYDARSYRDMGLDVVPMRSINRIVADKMKSGHLTVLDKDYTRQMIEAELRQARGRRDRRLTELDKLRRAIDGLAARPGETRANASAFPKGLRPSAKATLTGKVVRKAGEALLKARYAAYVQDVMEQSSRSTLDRIVEATDPAVIAKSRANTRDPIKREAMPDPALVSALHAEARSQRETFEAEAARVRRGLALRVWQATNKWMEAVGTKAPAVPVVGATRVRRLKNLGGARRALELLPEVEGSEARDPAVTRDEDVGARTNVATEVEGSRPKAVTVDAGQGTGDTAKAKAKATAKAAFDVAAFRSGLATQHAAMTKALKKLRAIASVDDRMRALAELTASGKHVVRAAAASAIATVRDAKRAHAAQRREGVVGVGPGVGPATGGDPTMTAGSAEPAERPSRAEPSNAAVSPVTGAVSATRAARDVGAVAIEGPEAASVAGGAGGKWEGVAATASWPVVAAARRDGPAAMPSASTRPSRRASSEATVPDVGDSDRIAAMMVSGEGQPTPGMPGAETGPRTLEEEREGKAARAEAERVERNRKRRKALLSRRRRGGLGR